MKDHTRFFSSMDSKDTSVQQKRTISRRSVLVSIAGLAVVGCAPNLATHAQATPGSSITKDAAPTLSSAGDARVGKTLLVYKGHSGRVRAVGWSPDGKYIASAGDDKTVQIWKATNAERVQVYRGHTAGVGAVGWSPDGKYIASGDGDPNNKGSIYVWRGDTGQKLVTYIGHANAITAIDWSPDGTRIISTGYDGTVQIWNALSGKKLLTLTVMKVDSFSLPVASLAVSPNGQHIVAGVSSLINGADQRPIKIYQSQTGKEILTYHDTVGGAQALSWSPVGGSIAMGQGKKIKIWSASDGKDITSLQAANAVVLTLAWSPDSKHLASGGGSTQAVGMTDNQVQVWAMIRKTVTVYQGHSAPVSSLSWSPNGTRIASASWDQTVQIWRAV